MSLAEAFQSSVNLQLDLHMLLSHALCKLAWLFAKRVQTRDAYVNYTPVPKTDPMNIGEYHFTISTAQATSELHDGNIHLGRFLLFSTINIEVGM